MYIKHLRSQFKAEKEKNDESQAEMVKIVLNAIYELLKWQNEMFSRFFEIFFVRPLLTFFNYNFLTFYGNFDTLQTPILAWFEKANFSLSRIKIENLVLLNLV